MLYNTTRLRKKQMNLYSEYEELHQKVETLEKENGKLKDKVKNLDGSSSQVWSEDGNAAIERRDNE